jgi:hypothetical protein
MIQSFQCPVCGTLNALGEPSCTGCGQSFTCSCPVCGGPVNNRYTNCPSCQTLFNWSRGPAESYFSSPSPQEASQNIQQGIPNQQPDTGVRENAENQENQQPAPVATRGNRQSRVPVQQRKEPPPAGITSRPIFWVMLMIACIIAIAALLFVDRLINA